MVSCMANDSAVVSLMRVARLVTVIKIMETKVPTAYHL